MKYIETAVSLPVYKTYVYLLPETLSPFTEAGKRALVPFGKQKVTAYILGPAEVTGKYKVKRILDILDEEALFPTTMTPFFRWIADYYIHPLGEVIRSALPGGLNRRDYTLFNLAQAGRMALYEESAAPMKLEIMKCLEKKSCRMNDLCNQIDKQIPFSVLMSMEKKGWITREKKTAPSTAKPLMEQFVSLVGKNIPEDRFYLERKKIINFLETEGEITLRQLKKQVPKAAGFLAYLEKHGYISIQKKRIFRDPFGEAIEPDWPPLLNDEQQGVVSKVLDSFGKGYTSFLVSGVTGSGKTEVYMQLAARVLELGYQVLVLVPEIALISQTERRFRARFGECIALLHSGLSTGERYDQWIRIMQNKVSIVIGARSAVFAPLSNIGLIIVDEEHDTSYKQDVKLHYNACDMAPVRAKLAGIPVILGSATPSIQSYYNTLINKSTELRLDRRVHDRPLPGITIVDLRKTRDERGIRRFITPVLHAAIKETLDRGEQTLIFLNRRGFSTFPVCGACGESLKCIDCDISLTHHQVENVFKCHLCGYTCPFASKCRVCGSSAIKLLGFGTEKVEAAIKALFPEARVVRMDRDTTSRKGEMLKILKDLKDKKTDILIGTQMVAKGHDFPNITLVGIICADLSLNFPDFRAGERTFQILAQVSGRAGRGTSPGRVVLQTYNPGHFCILSAKSQDFRVFYEKEAGFRKALNYPPFSRMIQLKISGRDKQKTRDFAKRLGELCAKIHKTGGSLFSSVRTMGPVEAPLSRIAQKYRWQILFVSSNVGILHRFVRVVLFENQPVLNGRDVKTVVDVDPFFMM